MAFFFGLKKYLSFFFINGQSACFQFMATMNNAYTYILLFAVFISVFSSTNEEKTHRIAERVKWDNSYKSN